MRRNKIKLIVSILVAVTIVLIACIAIIFVGKKALDERQAQIDSLQYEIDSNKQVVYVAINDIAAGESLVESNNIMKQEIYTGLEEDYYMTEDMVGGIAVLDIKALQPIMSDMVTSLEITNDTREYEISVANLMTDQTDFDYVDLRIMFPTGEDYTILSKKCVQNLNLQGCTFFSYLDEDEILRIASATIDAYTITGTYIYTTRYIEPSLQAISTPNYVVKPEVIDLINSDPNILNIAKETLNLEARIALEQRLRGLSDKTLEAIASGHEMFDTAKNSTLLDMEYSVGDNNVVLENGDEDIKTSIPSTNTTNSINTSDNEESEDVTENTEETDNVLIETTQE